MPAKKVLIDLNTMTIGGYRSRNQAENDPTLDVIEYTPYGFNPSKKLKTRPIHPDHIHTVDAGGGKGIPDTVILVCEPGKGAMIGFINSLEQQIERLREALESAEIRESTARSEASQYAQGAQKTVANAQDIAKSRSNVPSYDNFDDMLEDL